MHNYVCKTQSIRDFSLRLHLLETSGATPIKKISPICLPKNVLNRTTTRDKIKKIEVGRCDIAQETDFNLTKVTISIHF